MKLEKYYESSSSLITGIALIILGFILIFLNESFYKYIVLILIYSFLIIGIRNFITYFTKKNKNLKFINCLFHLIFAVILLLNNNLSLSILPIIMGFYFLLNFSFQLIDFIIIVKNKDKGSLYKLLLSFIYLIFGLILIFNPLANIKNLLICIGIYLILLGSNYIYDFITSIIPKRYKSKIKRRFKFTLPVMLEAIIPYQVLNEINKYLSIDDDKISFKKKKNDESIDLEVFVHVSPNGFNRMGHVDLYFDKNVISYGNYDRSSVKYKELFGDGVLFVTSNRDKYLNFAIEHSKKTIFAFGLTLNENQKKAVRNEIDKIKSNLTSWLPASEINKKGNYKDYASILYNKTHAAFYKFKKGSFKTYFVLGNNCCLLADKIIGKSGVDILKMNGLITPGTYYEYLNKEFYKKGSMVVSKNIYNERRKGDKYDKK